MNIQIRNGFRFQQDEEKNRVNKKKHGVSFEEAITVFYDEDSVLIPDPDHSDREERFIIMGMSLKAEVLTVVHCLRDHETIIRIISARKATRNEKKQYFERKN